MILPTDQSTDDLQFKSSSLKINKEKLIEFWGENDGNKFVSQMLVVQPNDKQNKCVLFFHFLFLIN